MDHQGNSTNKQPTQYARQNRINSWGNNLGLGDLLICCCHTHTVT